MKSGTEPESYGLYIEMEISFYGFLNFNSGRNYQKSLVIPAEIIKSCGVTITI